VNLLLDNLPLAVVHEDTGAYTVGVPLGAMEGGQAYLYNHLEFTIRYYQLTDDEAAKSRLAARKKLIKQGKLTEAPKGAVHHDDDEDEVPLKRIIAFVAKPASIAHDPVNPTATCSPGNFSLARARPQKATADHVVWSYSVRWERTEELWTTRWDVYLNVQDHEIHWFSILNSVFIVLLLTAMVAYILVHLLRRDLTKYNRVVVDPEDLHDETGWKLVHKDVFRSPEHGWLLSALVGTGAQIYGMGWVVIIFACLGFLSPANRGALFTAMLIFFVFLGMYAGYSSARLLKLWGLMSWKNIFATATVVPGIAFGTFFIVNLAVWSQASSGAVPFPTMFAIIAMWFCISMPLVFVGAVFGFKRDTIKLPVSISHIPRHIPDAPWHMNPYFTVAVAGVLPFGAVFIEVFFILTAVWLNRYYYVFGFLALVFIILTITCAEITVVMTYFQLGGEDWKWWWRAFLTSGSCGAYLFLYSVFYFFSSSMRMRHFVPILLYFSYMGLLSFLFAVMTGTVGFMATFAFVRYIYGSVKVD